MNSGFIIVGFINRGAYMTGFTSLYVDFRDKEEYYLDHLFSTRKALVPQQELLKNVASFKKGAPFLDTSEQEALYV